jgi:hypothetical protein
MRMTTLSHWTAGPFLVACALLCYSGAVKLVRPQGTRTAARAIGAPSSPAAVVVLGLIEAGLGIAGIAFGSIAAVGVAACYLALTFVVVRLLRDAPAVPCGCLGSPQATASRAHVVVNATAAAFALVAAPSGSPLSDFSGGALAAIVLVVLVVVAVALVSLTMDALPELDRLARQGSRT